MSILIDANRLDAKPSTLGAEGQTTALTAASATAALLGGKSVVVSEGGLTDLEALVARIKNESEKTKISILFASLNTIGASLSDAQRGLLEEGLALEAERKQLEVALVGYESDLVVQNSDDNLLLQTKIDMLQRQIDLAIEEGKDHNKLVAEQKRVRAEFDEKQRQIDETQGKIDATKDELKAVDARISAIVRLIGESALKSIARELAQIIGPEKAERDAEAEKLGAKNIANSLFRAIHDSLDEIERDIVETIEENRVEHV